MYESANCEQTVEANPTHFKPLLDEGAALPLHEGSQSESEPAQNNGEDTHAKGAGPSPTNCTELISRSGVRALPGPTFAFMRRSRLQRQQEVGDTSSALQGLSVEAPERGSLTPAMRKRYLKDLFLNNSSHSGFGSVLSSKRSSASSREGEQDAPDGTVWALYPMEHAWMLSIVDGNYDTIMDFLSEDPSLLTRKDFVSGYTALHWLAKSGQDETLIKVLRHAEMEEIPVNVNLKGGGGLTPLHVAAMHSQYMVIKLLVGAFGANIDAMDYSGRRAWQYLKGNAPEEMKELLGTWDDEHAGVGQQNLNNSACATQLPTCEVDDEGKDELDTFNRTRRGGSWRFGSFKKLLSSSFSFFGNKS